MGDRMYKKTFIQSESPVGEQKYTNVRNHAWYIVMYIEAGYAACYNTSVDLGDV